MDEHGAPRGDEAADLAYISIAHADAPVSHRLTEELRLVGTVNGDSAPCGQELSLG